MKISNGMNKKYFKIIIIGALVLWLCFFLFQQLNLVTADLGRFIKNGEQIFSGNWQEILRTNFYSFTHFQYPFLNHHWGTGVVFYLFQKIGGFIFLHLFTISLVVTTFLLLFKIAKKEAGIVVATLLSLLLIPLMAYRKEIRPEIFSCLFSASFFYILWAYRSKEISTKWLWLLPILEIIWVNLHIYFILGLAILGAFLLEKIILYSRNKKGSLKLPLGVFVAVLLATFMNPFGWKGVLHPFLVYGNYGYRILEEQSVWFLENLNIYNPSFLFFKVILVIVGLSFVWIIVKKRKEFPLVNFFLISGFAFMACWSIRNITLFAFMSLPILAINIKIIWPNLSFKGLNKKIYCIIISFVIIFIVCISYGKYLPANSGLFGLGLIEGRNKAIDFFNENNLQGPIFNNYDIGGYLIYHLFPQERVFVDNRPETYPADFFQDVYVPMQENENTWQEKSEEYDLNAIIFYWHDATPWGQRFLIARVQDNDWIPVFVDEQVIIFLKQNELNNGIIKKFEISQEVFQLK